MRRNHKARSSIAQPPNDKLTRRRFSLGYYEQRDVLGAIAFAKQRGIPESHMGLMGFSMGAAATLLVLPHTQVPAAVVDSSFADLRSLLDTGFPLPKIFLPGVIMAARLDAGVDVDQVSPEPGVAAPTGWHRDTHYWPEHPLHLEYLQLIVYLTDVDETTHCFTISPEPVDGEILEQESHLKRGGITFLHGLAGTGILFNSATVHGLTRRDTTNQRRILQIYYGHQGDPALSQVTIVPPRLWRHHPDPATRRFFSKHSRYSRLMHEGMGLAIEAPTGGAAA